MIRIKDKSECCGCTACYAACPYDAIAMKPDRLGFKYPEVDMDRCVDCGICVRVCAFKPLKDRITPEAYAARHKDVDQVRNSTSGAAFIAFSDYILEGGGVVYGASYDGHFRVSHKRVADKHSREGLRKSRYVQSDMGDVFRQVREDLRGGLRVLFTGTPCQVSGLKSYIGCTHSDNLYLLDIVCHGVPSPKVWEEYVLWQEKRHGEKVHDVEFRDKSFGWRSAVESFDFGSGKIFSKSYNYLFYEHLTLRESCSVCPYADVSRPSDLTMGDYWRKDKTCPDFASDGLGCSLILCHTEKGRKLLEAVEESMYFVKTDLEPCLQHNLVRPSELHPHRFRFEDDFVAYGLEYVMKRYGDLGWRYKMEASVKAVYQAVRQTARKLLGRR